MNQRIVGITFTLTLLASSALAQTDLVTNGSFEAGLTGWNWEQSSHGGGVGSCNYNPAMAPGVESSSGLPGFAATDGTQIVLGRVTSSSNTALIVNCVLYQDVPIPLGATTGSYSLDLGVKGVTQTDSAGVFIGIYPTYQVPSLGDQGVVGVNGFVNYVATGPDATLGTHRSGTFTLASRAGTTVRFAIIHTGRFIVSGVVGVDNVHFLVNVVAPSPQSVPALSGWGIVALAFLLFYMAYMAMRQGAPYVTSQRRSRLEGVRP